MELGLPNTLLAGDSRLIDHIVGEVKSQGIFDQFRKECIADVDTKPAYQNLRTRVEGSVNSFLSKQTWKPDLNKNQLRETLRKHIHDEPYLDAGVERIVDQVVNPKVYSVFMSQIEDVVYKFLGMERPKAREKNGACGLKDLLPKDLDPVSPESDKNSLKDVSLESVENDILEERREDRTYDEQRGEEARQDRSKDAPENGHLSSDERTDEASRAPRTGSNSNLNTSGRSNDKDEEEEEVSPTFEPIDIMNLNECNISNDSHLSGISELTSHRSRSPDFSNDLSRDNFDCSNQDSQLSKVSSDSRLSIVTDFGSSNHGLTPAHDSSKEETTKDKCEAKSKDNFKAIREESSKSKASRSSFDFGKSKDAQDYKESRDSKSTKSTSSKESSRDASDSGIKDKYEHKSSKERSKDNESVKSSKSTKEKVSSKEKYNRDKNNERRKSSSHSGTKHDKHGKSRSKNKVDQARENSDRSRDVSEGCKDSAVKVKEEKEVDKRDGVNKDKKESASKEVKDLKDLYKEKIRELREKKELTEKEKLNKDRETKLTKESSKDKKDPLKDKKPSKKEHRSSSSSSSSKVAFASHHESKTGKPDKTADGKDKKPDSRDRAKRDEKRLSKDGKSKAHCSSRTEMSEKPDKSDSRKPSKSEKDDKSGKADVKRDARVGGEKTANGRRDAKNHVHQRSKSFDRGERSDSRRDSKSDSSSKDKKRKEEKKSKTKDDHSSLRKNSNDRRSSDRDGSNGSNNKTSPASSSCSNVTGHKSGTSGLTKESVVSNSSSETSDSIEEVQLNESKSSHQSNCKVSHSQIGSQLPTCDRNHPKPEINSTEEIPDRSGAKKEEEETAATVAAADSCETDVFARKRSLPDSESAPDDVRIKKPKFAKNIHEAKKLMKLRRQMERQKSRESKSAEKTVAQETAEQPSQPTRDGDNLEDVPDDERVQIIEIPDEEYEEPYPEKHEPSLKLDESSMMMLGTESCANDFLNKRSDQKPMLSSMELRIKESLCEIVTSMPPEEAQKSSALGAEVARSHSPPGRCSASSVRPEDTQDTRENGDKSKDAIPKDITAADEEHGLRTEGTRVSETLDIADPEDKNVQQSTEENAKTQDRNARDDAEETRTDSRRPASTRVDNKSQGEKDEVSRVGTADSARVSGEDHEDCRYFKTDNEQSEKFSSFLETVEELENSSLEDIIESLGGRVVVTSVPRPMAAPTLHERSSALLSNILANNNNDGLKRTLSSSLNEDAVHAAKRRKFAKKPRFSSACNAQGIPNGENFVMPLSPDSDVSATSEKTASSAVIKEEKSRNRSSHQRYSSDDLYKPRPLFSSSSRRSRRTNQA